MTTVPYLKWKNRIFKTILSEMLKNEDWHHITYLVGNDMYWNQLHLNEYFDPNYERYYFDLLMIEFEDEEGYAREMFMPVPLLSKNVIKKIHKLLEIGALNVAHRQWHDQYREPFPKITSFYPEDNEYEDDDSEDYND